MLEIETQIKISPLREFWYYFRQNYGALFGLGIISGFIFLALFADVLSTHHPSEMNGDALKLPPAWSADGQWEYLLGTDDMGRDQWSRLLYGSRVSLGIGFLVVLVSALIGSILGMTAGFFGGIWDRIVLQLIDVLMTLPSILLAIVVVSIVGPTLLNTILAVAIVSIPGFTRLMRATTMSEKMKQHVTASKSFGASPIRLICHNIFPNCLAPLIIQAALGFSEGILAAAALGFLGLGAQAPTPEWGTMLADSRAFIESSPWLVTLPGLCILLVVLGFNLLGDGLRDSFDPRLRQ